MLIKSTVRGNPVLYSPAEALPFAVEYGVKGMNTDETIFWVLRDTIKSDGVHHILVPTSDKKVKASWEASGSGTVMVGKTDAKTDRFFEPKKHAFSIKYKTTKDSLGLPDIEIVEFKLVRSK